MKQGSKYARVGEFVRIVTPKEFVRCGYPLSIKDVMGQQFEEVEKDCVRMFAALEKAALLAEDPAPQVEFGFIPAVLALNKAPNMSPTVHGMLCAAAAAYRLEQQNFGGKERIIVEKDGLFQTGQLWLVTGKRTAKTGKRYPATRYHDDYKPGGLENEKTHCVYTVVRNRQKLKILAANCEWPVEPSPPG